MFCGGLNNGNRINNFGLHTVRNSLLFVCCAVFGCGAEMTDKITKSARGQNCTVRLLGVCNHNPETVVLAHINGVRFGHGVGIKTQLGAYACSACHDLVDMRTKLPPGMTWRDVKFAHYEGVMETFALLLKSGILS